MSKTMKRIIIIEIIILVFNIAFPIERVYVKGESKLITKEGTLSIWINYQEPNYAEIEMPEDGSVVLSLTMASMVEIGIDSSDLFASTRIYSSESKTFYLDKGIHRIFLLEGAGLNDDVEASIHYSISYREVHDDTVFTIAYNLDGGLNNETNPSTRAAINGDVELRQPTKEGYDFLGWYYSGQTQSYITAIAKDIKKDVSVCAAWKPIVYKINYNMDGGRNNGLNPSERTVQDGEIKLLSPYKEGYDFVGWYYEEQPEQQVFAIPENLLESVTLRAKWKLNEIMLQYELNGGQNSESNPDRISIESGEIVLQDAVKKGYKFKGWLIPKAVAPRFIYVTKIKKMEGDSHVICAGKNDIKDITGESVSTDEGKINLVADWELNTYQVNYSLEGGQWSKNAIKPESYTVEDKKTELIPSVPERSGYIFDGWNVSINGADYNVSQIDPEWACDITLTARWTKKSPSDYYKYEIKDSSCVITEYTGTKKKITIPTEIDGYPVTEIAERVFYKKHITKVTIPKTVLKIQNEAFAQCYSLTDVKFEMGSKLEIIGKKAFYDSDIRRLVIPKTVKIIKKEAFAKSSVFEIVFKKGSQLKKLENQAFCGLRNLKRIIFTSTKIISVSKNALKGINKNTVIIVPKNKRTKYKKYFGIYYKKSH